MISSASAWPAWKEMEVWANIRGNAAFEHQQWLFAKNLLLRQYFLQDPTHQSDHTHQSVRPDHAHLSVSPDHAHQEPPCSRNFETEASTSSQENYSLLTEQEESIG